MAGRRVGAAGWLLLVTALVANEWVLASLVSDDGLLEPLSLARVRICQGSAGVLGLLLIGLGRRVSRLGSLLALLRDAPRMTALGFGASLTIAMWLALEVVCAMLTGSGPEAVISEVVSADGSVGHSVAEYDPALGYRLIRNLDARMRLRTVDGRIIYDIDVVTDEFGRRVTTAPGPRQQHALFFGCSFTWGDAVQGDETLPAAFGAVSTAYRPYNYGFRGYGPQQTVLQLRNPEIRAQVAEPRGIAVFTAIDEHVRRTIGSMQIVSGVRRTFPYFRLGADGELVHDGSFVTGRPWRQLLYDTLSRSRILKYFDVDVPIAITDSHLALMAALLAEARDQYQARFGSDDFYVLLYPGSKVIAGLRPHLDRHRVRYLDYTDLLRDETRPTIIAGDGHPTPLSYRITAERLAADLARLELDRSDGRER